MRSALKLHGVCLSLCLAVLSACGGGGGGDSDSSAPPSALTAPSITQQPASVSVAAGVAATFTVVASGSPTLVYQWQRNGLAIAGATASSYATPVAIAGDDGSKFTVTVSNSAGSATSTAAVLTVTAAVPVVTTQPSSQTLAIGGAATLTVAGSCTAGALTIQWQRMSGQTFVDIPGATAATLSFVFGATDDGAQFRAHLTCGGQAAADSGVATLHVTAATSITLTDIPVAGRKTPALVNAYDGIVRVPNGDYLYCDGSWIRRLSADLQSITTVVGVYNAQTFSIVDGPAATARVGNCLDLAADATGNVFFVDGQTVRKLAIDGTVSTIAGTTTAGTEDGVGAAARFKQAAAVAVGPDGDLYVADEHRVRRVTQGGTVTTYAGATDSGYVDGTAANARFYLPLGIAVASNNDVYVSDTFNNRLRRIARSGTTAGAVSTVAGMDLPPNTDDPDGVGTGAVLVSPAKSVLVGSTLYVRDFHLIRKIDLATFAVTTMAGNRATQTMFVDGEFGHAEFGTLGGIASAPGGGLMMADGYNPFNGSLRAIAADGYITTIATHRAVFGRTDSTATGVLSQYPLLDYGPGVPSFVPNSKLVYDPQGRLVVHDEFSGAIQRLDAYGNLTLIAGLPFGTQSGGDTLVGVGRGALIGDLYQAFAIAPSGIIYASNYQYIDRIDLAGSVTQFTNYLSLGFQGVAAALSMASNGDLFQGEYGDQGASVNVIRRIDGTGNSTVYAGVSNTPGLVDGPIATARLREASSLATGSDGTLWFVDMGVLRRVAPDGQSIGSISAISNVSCVAVSPEGVVFASAGGQLVRVQADGSVLTTTASATGPVQTGSASPSFGDGGIVNMTARDAHTLAVLTRSGRLLQVTLP